MCFIILMITAIMAQAFEQWQFGLFLTAETDIFPACYLSQQEQTVYPVFLCGLQ